MVMAQPKVFITLNLPEKAFSGKPIIASYNPALLRFFKHIVLQDWQERLEQSPTEEDAIVNAAELDRLRSLLNAFIPNGNDHATV